MAGREHAVSATLVESVATIVSRELNIPTNKTLALRIITAHGDTDGDFQSFERALENYGKFRDSFVTNLHKRITASKYQQINEEGGSRYFARLLTAAYVVAQCPSETHFRSRCFRSVSHSHAALFCGSHLPPPGFSGILCPSVFRALLIRLPLSTDWLDDELRDGELRVLMLGGRTHSDVASCGGC